MINPINKKCFETREKKLFLNLFLSGTRKRRTSEKTHRNCKTIARIPRIKLK